MATHTLQEGYGRINIFVGGTKQRGRGVGSFLGGLFRTILPILKSGAKVAGREAAKAGVGVLTDIATRRLPPRESIKARLRDTTTNLKRAADERIDRLMTGSGYKKRRVVRTAHSRVVRPKRRTAGRKNKAPRKKKNRKVKKTAKRRLKKTKRAIADIFT